MRTLLAIGIGFWAIGAGAVEQLPNGCRILWERRTNDVSYSVWRTIPPGTNWNWIANITNTVFVWSNAVPVGTLFGVSAITIDPETGYHVEDIGVASWPPSIADAPTNGIALQLTETNRLLHLLGSENGNDWQLLAVITNGFPAMLSASRKARRMTSAALS